MELYPLFSNRKLAGWVSDQKPLKASIHTATPPSLPCLTPVYQDVSSVPLTLELSLISFHMSWEPSNSRSPGRQPQTLTTETLLCGCQWQARKSSLKGVTDFNETARFDKHCGCGTHPFTQIHTVQMKPHKCRNRFNYCRIKQNCCNILI